MLASVETALLMAMPAKCSRASQSSFKLLPLAKARGRAGGADQRHAVDPVQTMTER